MILYLTINKNSCTARKKKKKSHYTSLPDNVGLEAVDPDKAHGLCVHTDLGAYMVWANLTDRPIAKSSKQSNPQTLVSLNHMLSPRNVKPTTQTHSKWWRAEGLSFSLEKKKTFVNFSPKNEDTI